MDTHDPRPRDALRPVGPQSPEWLALSREDVAAVVAAYRRDVRSPRQWAWFGAGWGGVAAGVALVSIGGGWSAALGLGFFGGGWAVMVGAAVAAWRREKRLRAKHQISCPACDAPLLDKAADRRGMTAADLVVATGNCPRCGAQILAP